MARANLFGPLQKAIEANALIQADYKLQFEANLDGSFDIFVGRLFGLVKQNIGELRGEDESREAVRGRFDQHLTTTNANQYLKLCHSILEMLRNASRQSVPEVVGISPILRKDKSAQEVYNLIFSAEWIEPKYTIRFQGTKIEQLSPGQRGALLLIFYLLVDTGRNPIVLDQPEENLDNETIVNLLVPVLDQAKTTRQIFMVTHNPNLAVVCDAEQVIHADSIGKKAQKSLTNVGPLKTPV